MRTSPFVVSTVLVAGMIALGACRDISPTAVPSKALAPPPSFDRKEDKSAIGIVDLGVLGNGTFSFAFYINNRGQIAGNGSQVGPLFWDDGNVTELSVPAGFGWSEALGMDDRGRVAGIVSPTGSNVNARGAIWANGAVTVLSPLLGDDWSYAWRINARGQVAGISGTNAKPLLRHGVLWDGGTLTDLGVLPGGTFSVAEGLNDAGDVVGRADGPGFAGHAVLWKTSNRRDAEDGGDEEKSSSPGAPWKGTLTDLGTLPGGTFSQAWSINAKGQIAGYSSGTGFSAHAVLWDRGVISDLGTLPCGTPPCNFAGSAAEGINVHGQIAGYSFYYAGAQTSANFVRHAVLWDHGTITDLGVLPGARFSFANSINDDGQIVGASGKSGPVSLGGFEHAVLWCTSGECKSRRDE